ncbi:MAG: hypothetical protein SGJ13_07820 [Actinomycetota bacterium]|nr:hypothetical protein [Actinomycetota bacterium]
MNGITEDDLRSALREDAGTAWATDEGWDRIRGGGEKQRGRRHNRFVIAGATLTAAAAALAGVLVITDDGGDRPITAEQPEATCSASGTDAVLADGIAEPMRTTAASLLEAASACDYDALRVLMDTGFTYAYDDVTPDEAIELWRDQEDRGIATLAAIVGALRTQPFCLGLESDPPKTQCTWSNVEVGIGVTADSTGAWSVYESSGDDPNAVQCQTRLPNGPTVATAPGMPDAVLETANEIVAASMRCDYDALRALMVDDFGFSLTEPADADLAVEMWRLEGVGEGSEVFQVLVDRLVNGEPVQNSEDLQWAWFEASVAPTPLAINPDGTWANFSD